MKAGVLALAAGLSLVPTSVRARSVEGWVVDSKRWGCTMDNDGSNERCGGTITIQSLAPEGAKPRMTHIFVPWNIDVDLGFSDESWDAEVGKYLTVEYEESEDDKGLRKATSIDASFHPGGPKLLKDRRTFNPDAFSDKGAENYLKGGFRVDYAKMLEKRLAKPGAEAFVDELFYHRGPIVEDLASDAMVKLHDHFWIGTMLQLFQEGGRFGRVNAARYIDDFGEAAASPDFMKDYLWDENPVIRRYAVTFLGKTNARKYADLVQKVIDTDQDQTVVKAARIAQGRFHE